MNFIAHYAANNDYEYFNTLEEAKQWLSELHSEDAPEGFSIESVEGRDFIAVITHRSTYVETHSKKEYTWDEEACGFFNKDEEEWPGDNGFDSMGEIILKEVKPDGGKNED